MSKKPIYDEGRMKVYSVTLPDEYATVLRIVGHGFLSQGVRTLIETHSGDLVTEVKKWKLERIRKDGIVAKKRWPKISDKTVDLPRIMEEARTLSEKRRELLREEEGKIPPS